MSKEHLRKIIFEAETPSGKLFDIILIWLIIFSIIVVMLESVSTIRIQHGLILRNLEWILTILFTIEYFIRIICIPHPLKYIFSFFGLVDLLSILPTYLSLFFDGAQTLLIIRAIRLLRIFRVLKLAQFLGEAKQLVDALKNSWVKIIVFLGGTFSIILIFGSLMYLIEGEKNGFTSIPKSIYWAIVTMTTVGYGDIAPQTILGQIISSAIMLTGYGIIAVPTGIVVSEYGQKMKMVSTITCPECLKEGHRFDASFCRFCGGQLNPPD